MITVEEMWRTLDAAIQHARADLRAARPQYWPDVPAAEFEAVLASIGEITRTEAALELTRLQERYLDG